MATGRPATATAPSDYGSSGYGAARNGGAAEYPDSGYTQVGYDATSYGQSGYGTGTGTGSADYAARGSAADYNQSGYSSSYATEFMPAEADDAAYDAATGTPRPIGRLSIYTLLDDKSAEFDQIAERAAEGVRSSEPDTLVYVIHVVPKAPMQRIIYEIYRDRAAFESHERQPHIQRFTADRASCVLATNIIDLRLKYAKVAALGQAAGRPPRPRAAARVVGPGDVRAAGVPGAVSSVAGGGQYGAERQNGGQYGSGQYDSSQYAGDQSAAATRVQYPAAAAAASFTQADDRYAAAGTSQYTGGRDRPVRCVWVRRVHGQRDRPVRG